ncbi:uncharacterized protein LOC127736014 [Mytilus californianus]|uniref:uncharacterized protein LOC127736014 n=1 Tax=Mytilus californianus TaxID=6549 RepID=UPI002245182D|nr:uncharacterized protein LOC127736014 [Mytilus californianus]
MNKAKDWCKAIFILPLTAGNLKNKIHRYNISHDGSIAGLIMLTSLVVILAEVMYICNTFEQKSSTAPVISRPLLIVLNCIGIVSCVSVGIREKIRKTYILDIESHDKSKSLKLKFLYLFCLGSVVFRILKIAFHVECKVFVHINESLEGAVLYNISCLSFYVVQTCFIYYFSKYQFVNSLFTFYGLIIIVVTNISSWTYYATSKQNVSDTSQNTTYRCVENNSSLSIRQLLHNVSPFIEPMLAEYSLLCLIFLSGIWPRTSHKQCCIEEDNNATYETSEMTALLQSQSIVSCRPITVPRKQVLTYCIILISGIISLPRLIIEILRLLGVIGTDFFWISSITTIFEYTVLLLALAVCFHAVQHQCMPRIENTAYDTGNVLLILSFIITTGYYTLYLMAKILPIVTKYRSLFIIKGILRIIVLYLQTVYILQMKKYTITSSRSQLFSVNYICLLIGLINFGYWISYTFLVVQYVYKFQNPVYYSSIHIENTETFLFPFVMFYRFESFMCFYSLYRS